MVRHNLTLSLRLFTRNRFYAITSIIGLSFGLTIAILISLYVRFELSFEQNNPLSDRIVRVTMDYLNGVAVIDQDAGMYRPAGPRILAEFKGVEDFTRAYPVYNTTIKAGNESFRENSMFAVDPSFLTMFNCDLLAGSKNVLTQPYEAILTESAAVKYFGRRDVLGESIQLSWFDQPFRVTGLIADAPSNTHIKYSVLISQATYQKKYQEERWDNNDQYTYILLSDPSQYSGFNEQLNTLNTSLHAEGKILNERIVAQRLNDIHLYSDKGYELEQSGDPFAVYFLMGIAILVLCIAIVNHINLSTAKSLERAKEVGVRKVIGSSLTQLRIQFFTESLVINIVSAVFAAVLVTAFLPAFQEMAGLPANVHTMMDANFYMIVVAGVLATSVLSSIFPSLILSGFHPMKALKGKFSRSAGGVNLRKALVVVQFSITMFLLVQTFTASRQLDYMRTKDLGLDIEQTIVVRTAASGAGENYQVFKDRLQGQTDVQSVSYSGCVPGMPTSEMGSTNVGVTVVGGMKAESFNFYITFVDADFIKTMGMDLTAGSDFVASDQDKNKILVNEEAIRLWNLPDAKTAVGQKINLWGAQREIVGVIKNFHQTSPKEAFLPMIMFHQEGSNKLASVRVKPGDLTKEIALIKDAYQGVFPGSPFEYFFLDEEFDRQYRADEQFGQVFQTLTTFALLISALGLFGLVSVAVANRTKEIGIRKVLGASAQQILNLISRDFVGLVVLSVIVSTAFTYFVVSQWVERYAFRIELEPDLFLLPALFIVGLSVVTVAARALRAATVNPVNSLKEE